ncbi:hypothetical protein NA78x_000432 [Anatilimnocola sp. NA78]|uniref:hypothetical protein n=1 Tax=Anatilimnocola sp. NA78 TaxID=3415683 RepID=UPI003CE4EB76
MKIAIALPSPRFVLLPAGHHPATEHAEQASLRIFVTLALRPTGSLMTQLEPDVKDSPRPGKDRANLASDRELMTFLTNIRQLAPISVGKFA